MAELEEILYKVSKPARYIGGEWNGVVKDWDAVAMKVDAIASRTYQSLTNNRHEVPQREAPLVSCILDLVSGAKRPDPFLPTSDLRPLTSVIRHPARLRPLAGKP